MAKLHIKKGDTVRVIAGESKGAEGTVRKVFTEKNRAIVEGDDIKKMSIKPEMKNVPKGSNYFSKFNQSKKSPRELAIIFQAKLKKLKFKYVK